MASPDDYTIIHWSGEPGNPAMAIDTLKHSQSGEILEFNQAVALNKEQSLCWVVPQADVHDIAMYAYSAGRWLKEKDYPKNPYPLLQLKCSEEEKFIIGTYLTGFLLWNIATVANSNDGSGFVVLKLPSGIRNITTRMNKSNSCVLSARQEYAIAGIRKELYIWSVETSQVKCHFLLCEI